MSASDHDSRFDEPRALARGPSPKLTAQQQLDAELHDMVLDIDQSGEGLTDWEINLIDNLIGSRANRFTPAQAKQIRRIHQERVRCKCLSAHEMALGSLVP